MTQSGLGLFVGSLLLTIFVYVKDERTKAAMKEARLLLLSFGIGIRKSRTMFRRSVVTAVLAVTLLSFPASAAKDVSTREMAHFCRAHVSLADKTPHEPTDAELFSSGMCIGYMKGYRDGVDGQNVFDVGGLVYCIPPEATNGQLAEVYAKWAGANPEKIHHSAAVGFARVMADSFPCKQ